MLESLCFAVADPRTGWPGFLQGIRRLPWAERLSSRPISHPFYQESQSRGNACFFRLWASNSGPHAAATSSSAVVYFCRTAWQFLSLHHAFLQNSLHGSLKKCSYLVLGSAVTVNLLCLPTLLLASCKSWDHSLLFLTSQSPAASGSPDTTVTI